MLSCFFHIVLLVTGYLKVSTWIQSRGSESEPVDGVSRRVQPLRLMKNVVIVVLRHYLTIHTLLNNIETIRFK